MRPDQIIAHQYLARGQRPPWDFEENVLGCSGGNCSDAALRPRPSP